MRSDTQSISLAGRPSETFAFLANPEHLPRWAVGFCRNIRLDERGRWIVETANGDVPIRYVAHAECGTIDFHMEVASGVEVVAYSRVIPHGAAEGMEADGADYVFTQFQTAAMSDEAFERQVTALKEELRVLQSICRARAACVACPPSVGQPMTPGAARAMTPGATCSMRSCRARSAATARRSTR